MEHFCWPTHSILWCSRRYQNQYPSSPAAWFPFVEISTNVSESLSYVSSSTQILNAVNRSVNYASACWEPQHELCTGREHYCSNASFARRDCETSNKFLHEEFYPLEVLSAWSNDAAWSFNEETKIYASPANCFKAKRCYVMTTKRTATSFLGKWHVARAEKMEWNSSRDGVLAWKGRWLDLISKYVAFRNLTFHYFVYKVKYMYLY